MQLQQQQQPPGAGSSNGSSSHTAAQPPAVLLCGDFNTTPDSDTVRVSTVARITLLMTGVRGSCTVRCGHLWQPSAGLHFLLLLQVVVGLQDSMRIDPVIYLLCSHMLPYPCCVLFVQTIQQHGMGLNSIWDVPWAAGETSPNNGSNGSKGSSSSAAAARPTNGGSSSSNSGGVNKAGSNGRQSGGAYVGSDAAAAGSNGNGHQSAAAAAAAGVGQQPGPAPAQEGSEFTTWKFRSNGVAKRTIDYVWYSNSQLVPVSRWRMLSEAEIGPTGLPNTVYPSDHMAVTCQFGWVDSS